MKRILLAVVVALSFNAAGPAVRAAEDPKPKETAKEEGREHRDRFKALSARANAVSESLADLSSRLRAEGLSVRTSVIAARNAMETYMDDAQEAIRGRDWSDARRCMDKAEAKIKVIEEYLGAS